MNQIVLENGTDFSNDTLESGFLHGFGKINLRRPIFHSYKVNALLIP